MKLEGLAVFHFTLESILKRAFISIFYQRFGRFGYLWKTKEDRGLGGGKKITYGQLERAETLQVFERVYYHAYAFNKTHRKVYNISKYIFKVDSRDLYLCTEDEWYEVYLMPKLSERCLFDILPGNEFPSFGKFQYVWFPSHHSVLWENLVQSCLNTASCIT